MKDSDLRKIKITFEASRACERASSPFCRERVLKRKSSHTRLSAHWTSRRGDGCSMARREVPSVRWNSSGILYHDFSRERVSHPSSLSVHPLFHRVFVYSSCFQSLNAEIWFVASRSWFWATIMAPPRVYTKIRRLFELSGEHPSDDTQGCVMLEFILRRDFWPGVRGKDKSFLFLSHSLTESNCFNLSLCAR